MSQQRGKQVVAVFSDVYTHTQEWEIKDNGRVRGGTAEARIWRRGERREEGGGRIIWQPLSG